MCGRFSLGVDVSVIAGQFLLAAVPPWRPRYNIAPMQDVPVIRLDAASGHRRADLLRWGLVPAWAEDPKVGNRMINARAESVSNKPAFRQAFHAQRCIVPADGFFEWRKADSPRSRAPKQPYWISREDGRLLALAGLWETWRSKAGSPLETFTILTTDASPRIKTIHDRMPVVLEQGDLDRWLDPSFRDEQALRAMLKPARHDALAIRPVSPRVNSPNQDDRTCIEPLALPSNGDLFEG